MPAAVVQRVLSGNLLPGERLDVTRSSALRIQAAVSTLSPHVHDSQQSRVVIDVKKIR